MKTKQQVEKEMHNLWNSDEFKDDKRTHMQRLMDNEDNSQD